MILYPPVRFDANEWFILAVSLLSWGTLCLLPRRSPAVTFFVIWLFNGLLGFTADFTLGVKPFDLYDFGDRPQFEWFDVVLYFVTYPPAPFLMLYGFDKWRPTGWKLAGRLLLFTAATTALEGATTFAFHVFTYKGWKLWYSPPVYLTTYSLNLLVYLYVRNYLPPKSSIT
ncbi:hypothetical protein LJK87_42005 [Paenibacillus sp. P25]|nr:hypothetical protein LJK87_42005 [Paenibacillus sp. P25]